MANAVGLPPPDLLSPGTVLFSVANIGIWGGVGFNMIILYTALRGIPQELYDAARVDGASEIQIALRVKVPLMHPGSGHDHGLRPDRDLQVYSEPATLQPMTDSHHLDLGAADGDLPGRLRQQRHLLRPPPLGAARRRHLVSRVLARATARLRERP